MSSVGIRLALKVIRDYSVLPPGQRNLLRILLVEDEAYRQDQVLYEATARRLLAKFRVDYSQAPGDPAFEELIAELSASCPIFNRLWGLAEVAGTHEAVVTHPRGAGITFEHSSYVPEGNPKQRLIIFTPCNDASAAKVREALAQTQVERPPLVGALAGIRTARSRFAASRLRVLRFELAPPPR